MWSRGRFAVEGIQVRNEVKLGQAERVSARESPGVPGRCCEGTEVSHTQSCFPVWKQELGVVESGRAETAF